MADSRQIQAIIIKSNLPSNTHILTHLLSSLSSTDSSHHSMLLYSQILPFSTSLQSLQFSLPSVLKSCGKAAAFEEGRQLHAQISKTRFQLDPYIANSLLRMYIELGQLDIAQQVFDKMAHRDVISFNSMISGRLRAGEVALALRVFDEMPRKDVVTMNSMIDGLMKCKRCDLAADLFERMAERDVVTWTSMVSGYVLNDRPKEALELFREMLDSGVRPDVAAIVNVLSAIADLGFQDEGKWVHAYVRRSNIELSSGVLGSALIDMYSKCGLIADARCVFRSICQKRRLGDWNSMISGLSIHGLGREALDVLREMERMEIEPDEITFLGILKACSHSGLVEEGRYIFKTMCEKFRVTPRIQHYGCLIDLLSRAGLIKEAQRAIEEMPMEPDAMIWKSMLSSCLKYGYATVGEHSAMKAIEVAPYDSSSYVLLSNLYAKLGRWEDVDRVRALMKGRGVRKVPGCSAVMIHGKVHEFLVGKEMGVGCREVVLTKLAEVISRLKLEGYEPDLTQVLVDVEEGEKESLLSVHSEKMAIAFGLINGDKGDPIHIVKNLRVCDDCHSFSKLVSKVYKLEIILRDQNRFHHFREGSCSCHDYW